MGTLNILILQLVFMNAIKHFKGDDMFENIVCDGMFTTVMSDWDTYMIEWNTGRTMLCGIWTVRFGRAF